MFDVCFSVNASTINKSFSNVVQFIPGLWPFYSIHK